MPPCYADWRERRDTLPALQDHDAYPPERLLQALWNHQRLRRDDLRLTDGRSLRVLHPGFLNRGAGPDFQGAVLHIAHEPPRRGDVEIDLHSRNWRQHAHDRNPAFARVILHVVWEAAAAPEVPTLRLSEFLEDTLPEAAAWLGTEEAERYPKDLLGRCASPLASLPPPALDALWLEAARVRLERKAALLRARAAQAGWAQALWEALARGLGYHANTWPMLRLGELRPWLAADPALSLLRVQARLMGVAGLLPSDLGKAASSPPYLGQLWDLWWRERDQFSEFLLPPSVWRLAGLRPANHPCRRLALLAEWWTRPDFIPRLEQWLDCPVPGEDLAGSLASILQGQADSFWNWHWTFRGARLRQPQPLIGQSRVTDLAVNVILPWLQARAAAQGHERWAAEVWRRYQHWPAAQTNAVLRLAGHRLLGGVAARGAKRASRQQGIQQVVEDFCETSDALCSGCLFPEQVAGLARRLGSPEP